MPRHDGLRRLVQHLNYIYKSEPALWDLDDTYEGFEWIDFHDADNSVVAFMRKSREGDVIVFVGERDAAGAARLSARRPGVPGSIARSSTPTRKPTAAATSATWAGIETEDVPWMGANIPFSFSLPPLATLAFKLDRRNRSATVVKLVQCFDTLYVSRSSFNLPQYRWRQKYGHWCCGAF